MVVISKTLAVYIGGLLVILGAFVWAVNSKQVVDYVFALNDPETEIVFEPSGGPMQFDETISRWEETPLSSHVEQPSGIEVLEDSLVLSTDKAEFLVFDHRGNLQSSLLLRQLPLLFRQGFAEGVACANVRTCYVVAGETKLFELRREGQDWQSRELGALEKYVPADIELQALAMNKASQLAYMAAILEETITVWVIDPVDGSVREQRVDVSSLVMKPSRGLAELEVIGLGHEEQTLYALTSPANLLLVIDSNRWYVRRVIGLEGLGDSQGVSVSGGYVHVVTDHEYHESLPPLRRAKLP